MMTLLTVASRLAPPPDPLLLLSSCDMLVKSSIAKLSCPRASDGGVEISIDGSGEGISVSAFDDGLGVGRADGTTDGCSEGIMVGSVVDGKSEGRDIVGTGVGAAVGSAVVGELLGPLLLVGDVVRSFSSIEVAATNVVGDNVGFIDTGNTVGLVADTRSAVGVDDGRKETPIDESGLNGSVGGEETGFSDACGAAIVAKVGTGVETGAPLAKPKEDRSEGSPAGATAGSDEGSKVVSASLAEDKVGPPEGSVVVGVSLAGARVGSDRRLESRRYWTVRRDTRRQR